MTRLLFVVSVFSIASVTFTGCPTPTGLVVNFDAPSRSGSIPLTVNFQNLTDQGGDSNTAWLWSFGDGSTSEERNPTHTYTQGGLFTVSLTAMNSVGTKTETKLDFILIREDPIASFYVESTPTIDPVVQFQDTSFPGFPPISAWHWDFGDGGTSTEQNPSHTYLDLGSYTVTLTVSSPSTEHHVTVPAAVRLLSDIDYHTQVLDSPNSLDGKQIYFRPLSGEDTPNGQFYERTVIDTDLAQLPVDPSVHSTIGFSEASSVTVPLMGVGVSFFGKHYDTLVIDANGTIAFGRNEGENATLAEHFATPNISLLPIDATAGGTVTFSESSNSVVVTFSGVTIGETTDNSMQLEIYTTPALEGEFTLSYPQIATTAEGIVGLSNSPLAGASQSEIDDFVEVFNSSDFSINSPSDSK